VQVEKKKRGAFAELMRREESVDFNRLSSGKLTEALRTVSERSFS